MSLSCWAVCDVLSMNASALDVVFPGVWCVCGGLRRVSDDSFKVHVSGHVVLAHLPSQHSGGDRDHRDLCVLPGNPGGDEGEPLHAHLSEYQNVCKGI